MKPVRIKLNLITEAEKLVKMMKQDIVFKGAVNKIHDSSPDGKKVAPRILIITKQFICYVKPESKPKIDRKYYWTQIKKYDSKSPQINMEFYKTTDKDSGLIRFKTIDMKEVEAKIFDILHHVLSQDELQALDLRKYKIPKYDINGLGIMQRYYAILEQDGKKSSKEVERQLMNYLPTYNKIFKLMPCDKLDDLLPSICQALKPYTPLESLIIPKLDEGVNLYKNLSEIIVNNFPPVRHISLAIQPDHQFIAFADAAKTSEKLQGFTFQDVAMTDDSLTMLQSALLELPKFCSLAFINCLKPSNMDFFTSDFLSGYVTDNLYMFNLDRTQGLDLHKIFNGKDYPRIRSLSFAECDLDVADALKVISRANLTDLRYLNLSGNHATTPFDRTIDFPRQLIRLDVNNVAWGDDVITTFFNTFLHHNFPKGIHLYIEYMHIKPEEFPALEKEFADAAFFNILTLGWSGNIITDKFLDFVQKNNRITTLFLSDIFSADDESFKTFLIFVNSFPYLQNLVIRGTNDHYLGADAIPLIKVLAQNKTLRLLDLTDQRIGDDGIKALSDVVENCLGLQSLVIDGTDFENLSAFQDLIKAGETRAKPVAIQYPLRDMEKGIETHGFKHNELDEIKVQLHRIYKPDHHKPRIAPMPQVQEELVKDVRAGSFRVQRSKPEKSPKKEKGKKKKGQAKDAEEIAQSGANDETNFDNPFDFYYSEFTDEFPLYINDALAREFQTDFNKLRTALEASDERKRRRHSSHKHRHSSKHRHHRHHRSSKSAPSKESSSSSSSSSSDDSKEWIEEEDIPDQEEEDAPETPLQKRIRELYKDLDYDAPEYKDHVERVQDPGSNKYINGLRNRSDLTPLINALVPK